MIAALNANQSINDYFKQAVSMVDRQLREMRPADLLASDDEQLVSHYLATEWALHSIEEDPSRPPKSTKNEHTRKRTLIIPLVPRESNGRTLQLRGSTWPMYLTSVPGFLFDKADNALLVTIDPTETELTKTLDFARRAIGYINSEIPGWTQTFKNEVVRLIHQHKEQRKREAAHDELFDAQLSSLGIVIAKKPDAIEPVNVQVKKPIQMLRALTTEKSKPGEVPVNPVALAEVIRLIDLIGKNFEVAPGTYNKLEEEDLRNIIVATLNAVFDSNVATGETFSRLGKVDIRLTIPQGDILIAECKIWSGQREYKKSINQLFRYLTHRHSVGMLITFVREKEFQTMVGRAGRATKGNNSYRADYQVKGPSYFVSTHTHPTDSEGEVVIHHLFFHLDASTPSD